MKPLFVFLLFSIFCISAFAKGGEKYCFNQVAGYAEGELIKHIKSINGEGYPVTVHILDVGGLMNSQSGDHNGYGVDTTIYDLTALAHTRNGNVESRVNGEYLSFALTSMKVVVEHNTCNGLDFIPGDMRKAYRDQ